jgi:hypothetical protein
MIAGKVVRINYVFHYMESGSLTHYTGWWQGDDMCFYMEGIVT